MTDDLLGDPLDGEPLSREGELLRGANGVWPVLGGVPVIVPDPARWLAAHRDGVLAALAEVGRADRATIDRLDAFTGAVRGVAGAAIADDFLADEDHAAPPLSGPVRDALAALWAAGRDTPDALAGWCADGPVLEVGCGAGSVTHRIAGRPLVVVDTSLRALLRATTGTDATPVVGDAQALPVRPRTFATVIAVNVVDLLDDPAAFVVRAADALVPGGHLVLTTPDPALGVTGGPDDALLDLVRAAGLKPVDDADGVPWIRAHGPRHWQVYLTRRVVARRPGRRR